MAGTYGEPGKNTFAIPGVGGILSPVVNATTGVSQIYRGTTGTTAKPLGTYNPNTNKFTADANVGLSPGEIESLSNEKNLKTIKDKSAETISKGVQAAGGTPKEGQATATKLLSPNKANNPTEEEQQAADLREELENLTFRSRDKYDQIITYPEKLDTNFQDYLKFQMVKYKPRGLGSGGNFGVIPSRDRINTSTNQQISEPGKKPNTGSSNSTREILGSVVLPIPGNISDSNTVSWGDARMDTLTTEITKLATSGIMEGSGGIKSSLEESIKSGTKNTSSLKAYILGKFTEIATGINPLTRMYGVIANPNLELLFNSPDLRNFTFTFRLSPRDAKEAIIVRKIIRFFKQGMSVKRTDGELFLGSPHTFQLSYWNTRTREHPYLNKFKECALKSFSVNYAPDGTYMTYNHKDEPSMTAYEITMQFTELEPIFDDDYGNNENNQSKDFIGY